MADHDDDLALVERMLAGERSALDLFAERYVPAVYRFAANRLDGDRERGRELAQRGLCKALAKLPSYRGEASLLTWLCACCRNEIRMDFRHQEVRRRATEAAAVEPAPLPAAAVPPRGPEARLLLRERRLRVHVVLDALPEHYAKVLEWKYVERQPVRRIAERLELGEKAAESLLTRARSAFRRAYDELRDGDRPAPNAPPRNPDHV